MEKLSSTWAEIGFQSLAEEIFTYIKSFPERIYANEIQCCALYRNIILNSVDGPVLDDCCR